MDKYTVEWSEFETTMFKMDVEADSETDAVEVVQELIEGGKIDDHPDLDVEVVTSTEFDDVSKTSD